MELRTNFVPVETLVPGEGALHAEVRTTHGVFVIRLHEDKAPSTVSNFVGLASGRTEWVDPMSGRAVCRPLYDGTEILRALPDLIVHFGDPTNSGRGGPGYRFDDEIHAELRHDRAGVVSMANAGIRQGAGTNGSQFFVLLDPRPELDEKYSVFGEVVKGMDAIVRMSELPTDLNDRPLQRGVIERVVFSRIA